LNDSKGSLALGVGATVGGLIGVCVGVWETASELINNWPFYNGFSEKILAVLMVGFYDVAMGTIFGALAGAIVLSPILMAISWVMRRIGS
jgi:hypothetical protein